MSTKAIRVREDEPIVFDLTRTIGDAIPGAPYNEVKSAALSVVLRLRMMGAISDGEAPASDEAASEPCDREKIPFWEVEGYAE